MQRQHVAVAADGGGAVAGVAGGDGAGDELPSDVAVAGVPVAGSVVAEFASSVAVAVASFAVAVAASRYYRYSEKWAVEDIRGVILSGGWKDGGKLDIAIAC